MRTLVKVSRAVLCLSIPLVLSVTALARERKPTGNRKRARVAPTASAAAGKAARTGPKRPQTPDELRYEAMSAMGAMASGLIPLPAAGPPGERASGRLAVRAPASPATIGQADIIVHGAGGDVALQTETTIAANATGTVLVAGYNDGRGFGVVPLSLSGIARSTDGGTTWNEVPIGPGGLGVLPSVAGGEVFGDPDVKYDPVNDRFVYSSLYVRPSDGLQGLCIHVSTDGTAAAWTGPIEVTPAFAAGGDADKEFMDINPATGRILLTWTHFAAGSSIRRTYSDNLGAAWAPAVTIASNPPGGFVTGSIPRFDPVTDNTNSVVYAVWRSSDGAGLRNIGCSRSTDGGTTWSAPVNLDATNYPSEDQVVGVDRVNTNPGLAVQDSTGRAYVVYQRNGSTGTGDIALRTFVGPCAAATPLLINSNPGSDRAQYYPSVAVDQSTGRVHAMWMDQDPQDTGDLHEAMYSFSTDSGATWSRPTPLLDRPFRAGFGNDTSQPNIGDYNQNIALNGEHHSLHGATSLAPRYDEGQPGSASLFTPDTYYDVRLDSQNVVSLRHVATSFVETGCGAPNGNIDPSETIGFTFTVENYVGNAAAGATTIMGITAALATATPDVSIGTGASAYPNIAPLATATNTTPLTITLASSFVPGGPVDLLLTLTTFQGSTEVAIRLPTGSPGTTTTLINEDFQGVAAPALPAGWTSINGGTASNDPWITSALLTPTNAVFHDNDGAQTEFMRLLSPVVTVPSVSPGAESHVTLDFDIVYRLEDEPTRPVLAYDGLTLRITDQTSGALLRSVLAEAFAESIRTGATNHFPKHTPRSSDGNYFQDMSVWSGDSGGLIHVSMKFPGLGMTGRSIQLRFEYTEDTFGDCTLAGHAAPCGVALDNIVLRHVVSAGADCGGPADLSVTKTDSPDPVNVGGILTYTLAVNNAGPGAATNVVVTDMLPSNATFLSAAGTGWACGHLSGTVTCTRGSLAVGPAPAISIQINPPPTIGQIVNLAIVTSDTGDPDTNNNSDGELTSVISPASVTATKTVAGTFAPAGTITYTVVLSNAGPAPKQNNPGDEFADVLPSSLTLLSAGASTGTANANVGTNTVTWNGSIPAAGSVTITISALINSGTGGTIVSNQGTAFFDADGNGTNESSAVTDDPGQPGGSDPTSFTVALGRDYFTLTPCRLADTRDAPGPYGGPSLPHGGTRTFVAAGQCNVSPTAKAVAGNVTVIAAQTVPFGDLRLYPAGTAEPLVSTINFSGGQTRANNVVLPVGSGGGFTVRCVVSAGAGEIHFIFDVVGYFE